jgi:hypothetical protein
MNQKMPAVPAASLSLDRHKTTGNQRLTTEN